MINRRLEIMRTLDSRTKFTARQLAERFGVSLRTIQRDLDYLQQMGVPLYSEVGIHGGYRVLPNRILPPLQLTQHEALGLFLMIEYLEHIPDFPYGIIRAQLADQYYSGLPDDVRDLISRSKQHLAVLQHSSIRPAPLTTQVLGAAVEKREISFAYHSRSGKKNVQVYPLGIYYEQGYWYMPASKQGEIRLYRVDRMEQLEEGPHRTEESLPTLAAWMKAGETRDSTEVILHFTDMGVRLAESDRIFASVLDREWRGCIPVEEFPFTAQKLLAYGPEVKVVSPRELQESVRELLEKTISQYS